jgi:hypothetical protein
MADSSLTQHHADSLRAFRELRDALRTVEAWAEPVKPLLWEDAGNRLDEAAVHIGAVLDYLNPGWDDPGDEDESRENLPCCDRQRDHVHLPDGKVVIRGSISDAP